LKTALGFYEVVVSAKGENVALPLSYEAYANGLHSDSSGRMTPAGDYCKFGTWRHRTESGMYGSGVGIQEHALYGNGSNAN
jgi:hypothetical protein